MLESIVACFSVSVNALCYLYLVLIFHRYDRVPQAIIGNAKVIFDLFVRGSADAEYQVRLVALGFWPEILKDSSAHPLLSDVLAA